MNNNDIEQLLERGVKNIIPNKNVLLGKLRAGKKLNVYFGIDPTSTKIHLGHAVPLRKLQAFAKLGHNVTFLIGDFTALIGDTSDKDSERPALTRKEIRQNFRKYKKQASKILDFSLKNVKIRHNSKWLNKLSSKDLITYSMLFSANDFLSRELIKRRLTDGKRVGLHEFFYPILQGYDSLILNTDLQIGGTDQTFNMQAGRTLIYYKESFVLSTPILEGPDGRKMSKSWGNAIWLDDDAYEIYRKVMSVPDEFLLNYFLLATNLETSEIERYERRIQNNENPIDIKKELAFEIVKELHNEKKAKGAQKEFETVVQKKELPINISIFTPSSGASVSGTVSEWANISASETKRLINQGGIELDGKTIDLRISKEPVREGAIIKIGKRPPIKIKK